MIERAILYTDGGSRGNPGSSGIGFVLLNDDGFELTTLCEGGAYIGEATNNEAEYQALIWGLDNAKALDVAHLSVRTDSELVVKQVNGEYRIKSAGIKPLFHQVMLVLKTFDSCEVSHVYREDNSRADTLANVAMDTRDSIGSFSVPWQSDETLGALFEDDFEPATAAPVPASGESHSVNTAFTRNTSAYGASAHDNSARTVSASTGVYTLTVKDHFDAAHSLIGYPGECRKLHGHTWDIEVSVSGVELDDVGIVYDFKDLKDNLATIIASYDHVFLNDVPPFNQINATAEHLARVIYERLEELLPAHVTLEEVSVWESPIAKLTYRR
ncbi:MAG: 6-carboxytetrahydropterin synthase QueD [Coriobacteriia bacterium]|nr:6-carboxytetrahydropterin synthase QueD [Coriobacteriia bacterium]